ncbi:HNH endonuclease [Mycobacterium phage Marvin]|uniref:HNH nuclease domain-containing protein n=1 Tax=Mycobacterium phage Marvin TaxID=1034139 RepID=G1BND5_9CAUD|nr:HNH endonuclease [Mycobacterium phage Marvin]AEJ95348.1 hypothetical protein MARVIN_65 [Mycobacterium phage Marvin]
MNEQRCTVLVRRRAGSLDPGLDEHSEYLPCEVCGKYAKNLERHHRQFRSRGGLWVPSNILLLCPVCHLSATEEREWTREYGMNVSERQVPEEVPVKLWHEPRMVCLHDDGSFTPAIL